MRNIALTDREIECLLTALANQAVCEAQSGHWESLEDTDNLVDKLSDLCIIEYEMGVRHE